MSRRCTSQTKLGPKVAEAVARKVARKLEREEKECVMCAAREEVGVEVEEC